MAQMGLLWWAKNTSTATNCGGSTATTTNAGGESSTSSSSSSSSSASQSQCCCLSRLVRKLKKQGRMLRRPPSRQSSLQCRYDPLSYSLNFDTSGCGITSLDDDINDDLQYYYRHCAFSSRFATTKPNSAQAIN